MATTFIDKARITVRAGNGGNGAVAFHREKYVAAGGPDGGDGGRGGSIILQVDDNMSTLMDFRYKRKYVAENGVDGQGGRKSGKDGANLVIRVPRGTLVRDAETNEIIQDMSGSEPYVLCKGGRGGWGNMHFATPTRQVPRFAKAGLPGESHDVFLELKLLADVGLIGFPNVGKSTFINKVAHRKTARAEDRPGVTRSKQWVPVDPTLELLDTPGILWPKFDDPEVGKRLAFTGAVKDDVLDIEELACYLMDYLAAHYADTLTERYKIEVEPGDTGYELLEKAGRKRGFLMRGAQVDTERMARILLDEFRSAKLGRFTLELP